MKRQHQDESWRNPDPEYPYLSNCSSDIRLLGGPLLLNPFIEHDSAARLDMYRSHLSQCLIVKGAEFPYIFTGKEKDFSHYELQEGAAGREQDGQILAVIRKYPVKAVGLHRIHMNPRTTVIYRGLEDNLIHYFHIDQYHSISDGFGFKNIFKNDYKLEKDTLIEKDDTFAHSYAKQGSKYCLGVNANVAYMTDPDTIEDAMVISRSLADKMESLDIRTMSVLVKGNECPVGCYSNSEETKFLPDIGEYVSDDGVLCAFRPIDTATFSADMNPMYTNKVQVIHDRIIKAPPGAQIVDIDFYTTHKRDLIPWMVYSQVEKYTDSIKDYWKTIIDIYKEYSPRYKASDRFNTLVTQAMFHYIAYGKRYPGIPYAKNVKFITKKNHPIDFMQIDIKYIIPRNVEKGFKISDRHGAKGVICRIVEDEDMPTDEQGIKADLIMDPGSVSARMNIGQLLEQAINRTSVFVQNYIKSAYPDIDKAWSILIDYYDDVNYKYSELVNKVKHTHELRKEHIEYVIEHGIFLNIPPTLNTFYDDHNFERVLSKLEVSDPDKAKNIRDHHDFRNKLKSPETYEENFFIFLQKKWGVVTSPVTYTVRNEEGPDKITFKTEIPICIGSKYIYLLCKIPEPSSPGIAHVSQHGIPMKLPDHLKLESTISKNPTRFGEDEKRIEVLSVGGEESARLTSLQAASPLAVSKIIDEILHSETPTQIDRFNITNQEARDSNTILALFEHIMETHGIDVVNTHSGIEDFPSFIDTEGDGSE